MYIKRAPLGRGNLSFRKRRRRYPVFLVLLYLLILLAALFVFWRKDEIQPKVLAMIGPEPTPTPSTDELVQLADEAYLAGDLEVAATYYQMAAEITPDDLDLRFDQARMLILTQDEENLQQAVIIADEIIELAPEDPRGYTIKSRALDWLGDYDQAVLAALQAIENDPEFALAHAYLGEAYTDLGRFRQAREQLELALQLDPYDVDIRRNYAYLLEHYGDYQGAIQQYLQALTLHSNLLDLWYGLAQNYRGDGQTDLAIETYSQIILRTPDEPLPYIELGKTYFEIRDDAAAQESFTTALALYEEGREKDYLYLRTLTRLAMVYFTRRNYEDAITTFEHAIEWGTENGETIPIEAYYVTASAYYYLDKCRDEPGDEWDIGAVDRAVEAFNIYQKRNLDDAAALDNILKVFVLCRDYTEKPYIHTGPGFVNGFPEGYPEPDVLLERPGTGGGEEEENKTGE
jgi:tetratricopeptide (TPR) repeat protein